MKLQSVSYKYRLAVKELYRKESSEGAPLRIKSISIEK